MSWNKPCQTVARNCSGKMKRRRMERKRRKRMREREQGETKDCCSKVKPAIKGNIFLGNNCESHCCLLLPTPPPLPPPLPVTLRNLIIAIIKRDERNVGNIQTVAMRGWYTEKKGVVVLRGSFRYGVLKGKDVFSD
eukprot:13532-Hanusia_phi.AAC.1